MSIQLTVPQKRELKPRIVVFGVGGAGGNAVNNMVAAGLEGVDFVVANTDAQALSASSAERRIQIGSKLTEGLGAGSDPEVGRQAAEETLAEITDMLQGSHMAFITAGMGGGTGTGAAPIIARAAREQGILTVGVVTKPFDFEGGRRMRSAIAGINELAKEVDTLIIIPNQNLFRIANAQTTFAEAFAMADEVLHSGVAGITDLMIKPGLINLDFADVRTVMNEMGKAMMGTGEGTGENRAIEAAEAAIANPLLDDVSMKGANGVLINISGGDDMTLYELDEAANRIKDEVANDANIIIGSTFDEALKGTIRVSVVATGIEAEAKLRPVADSGIGAVISMTPAAQPTVTPEVAQAMATADDMPATMAAPEAPAAVPEQPAPASGELPSFLTTKPMAAPKQEIPKQSRSFIERVFGGKKKTPTDTPTSALVDVAQAAQAPRADIGEAAVVEAPIVPEVPEALAVPEASEGQQEFAKTAAPAAFMEDLDGPNPVSAPIIKPQEVAVAPKQPDMVAEAEIEVEAKVEIAVETALEPEAEPTPEEPKLTAPVAPKAEALIVEQASAPAPATMSPSSVSSSPVSSPVSSEPNMQSTMQSGPSMSTSSSFESDQLDIPAFLRR
ncbi:cell division protein FtsZ [Alphaproteobacteria bacterium]|nr:cell division protein FtsZ [Alphaproteobacteria bacterium]MDC0147830.1 cell division protein FtsZ [Alphaproteobacteria bacterium]